MVRICARNTLFPARRFFAAPFAAYALCALPLSGCSVGPDYQKPALPLPAQWGSGNASSALPGQNREAELAGWWRRLSDAQLNTLISAAIADNLDVATAKARIREARATVFQTAGALLPSLNSSADYKRRRQTGGPTVDSYAGGFDSAWELDIFGANRRALEAAQAGFAASKEDLRATLVTLIGDVAANYVELRRLEAQLRLAQETADSQRRTANLISRKFQAGAVSDLDANNAAGQAADMESNIPRLRAQLAVIVHRLSVLLGQPPAAVSSLLAGNAAAKSRIPQPPARLPATIPADILLSRPDVRAAERRLAQATANIGRATALRYPDFSLTGNIATNSVRLGDLGKNSTIGWALGPALSLPLFRGGALKAGEELARAQRDQNFIAYRAAVLTALEDVENALVSLRQDRLTAQKKAEAAAAYRVSLTLSQKLYESGNTGFLELLTAERSYYSARQETLDARAAVTKDYISLMKALGGGWSGALLYKTPGAGGGEGAIIYGKPEIADKNTGPHFSSPFFGQKPKNR